AADGVRISARHDPPRARRHDLEAGNAAAVSPARDLALVVAHGFTGSWRRRDVRAMVGVLTEVAGVVSFDFRGHGASGGLSTVGDREVLDLDAAVHWARVLGYRRVVPVGWSMG